MLLALVPRTAVVLLGTVFALTPATGAWVHAEAHHRAESHAAAHAITDVVQNTSPHSAAGGDDGALQTIGELSHGDSDHGHPELRAGTPTRSERIAPVASSAAPALTLAADKLVDAARVVWARTGLDPGTSYTGSPPPQPRGPPTI